MSIKKYGIYLAYPPTTDLRDQGLGHYLAEFLKAAQERKDIRFVIACPSWMKSSLIELFEAAGVQQDYFEILSSRRKPILLIAYEQIIKINNIAQLIKKKKSTKIKVFFKKIYFLPLLFRGIVVIQKIITMPMVYGLSLISNILFLSILFSFSNIDFLKVFITMSLIGCFFIYFRKEPAISKILRKINTILIHPKNSDVVVNLFNKVKNHEAVLLERLIHARSDIVAWYCPTAFWPAFNRIKAPRLMCVPDVVMMDFPIAFAKSSNQRLLENFHQVEQAIQGGEYFVTYSKDVKFRTLAQRYGIDPEAIYTVFHGVKRINQEMQAVSQITQTMLSRYYTAILSVALHKSVYPANYFLFSRDSNIKFLFYASQFRPNKNILSLLKAYDYLLKRKYIPHKLILTGDPHALPAIDEFLESQNLKNDVICLRGLSSQELAACYKLADLAVNPSFSEGGCPFTLTEALSVDTPVVMARIPVTLEVIKDPGLDREMLFDPYDWKDMADRIEWAIQNKEELLAKQKILYTVLEKRTWRTVVDEYIDILDKISHKDLKTTDHLLIKAREKKALEEAA